MITAINRHQYRNLRRRFPGVAIARANETPAPAAPAATPATPAAPISPASVAIGTAGASPDLAAGAPSAPGGGRVMALGNASAAFATAIVERLTAFAIGYPVPDVDDLLDFLLARVEAPLLFDYLVDPDSNVLAAIDDDGIGNGGKPAVIRPDARGKIQAALVMRGLETYLTETEAQIAAAIPGWSLAMEKEDKIKWLHGCVRRGKAKRVFALIGTAVAADSATLEADIDYITAGTDPAALINGHIKNVANYCGYRDDVRVLFGGAAFEAFVNNAVICGGGTSGYPRQSVDMARIATLLRLPVANLMVTNHQVYDVSTAARTPIFDEDQVLVFSSRKNASRNDPSFLKDFYGKLKGNPLWVYEYTGHPMTANFGEAYYEHLAVTMAKAVRRLTVVAAQGEGAKKPAKKS